jgi:hypothetical protein
VQIETKFVSSQIREKNNIYLHIYMCDYLIRTTYKDHSMISAGIFINITSIFITPLQWKSNKSFIDDESEDFREVFFPRVDAN